MKDFSSYEPKEKTVADGNGDMTKIFAKFASAYEGKSGDEVMSAILAEAEKGRKSGALTDEKIDEFASAVAPFLSGKQRKMLETIVKRLKAKA